MSSSFIFLKELSDSLFILAAQAEKDIWDNPRSTLTQGRLFSEEMAIMVSKLEKLEPVFAIKSHERIHKLSREGILPQDVKTSFEWLRINGNTAAHDVKSIPVDLALSAHRHIFTLALWYVETYGDISIETPNYQMPVPPQEKNKQEEDSRLLNAVVGEQLEQLLNEQIETKLLPTISVQFKTLHETISKVAGSLNELAAQKSDSITVQLQATDQATPIHNSEIQLDSSPPIGVEVADFLLNKGLSIIDKRKNGGALWVVGGWELKDVLFQFKSHGIYFKFTRNGSQSTKRKPAWFLMGKDPTLERWVKYCENRSPQGQRSDAIVKTEANQNVDKDNTNSKSQKSKHNEATGENITSDESDSSMLGIVKNYLNKAIVFPRSMDKMTLDDLRINGCSALIDFLKDKYQVKNIRELPEELSTLTNVIPGVGPKTVSKFIQKLEDRIQEEKRLIGSGKRKEALVLSYRDLKEKLGRRPTYFELYKQDASRSQEYRLLFGSYFLFLLKANELNKIESSIVKRYEDWLKEAESTIIRKSYKIALLLAMLERGLSNWTNPVTAEEAAPFFYNYYMEDDHRRSIDFSDDETRKLWDEPLEKTARLISRMPMTHWGSAASKLVSYKEGEFKFTFRIRNEDKELLYEWTREICEYRLSSYFDKKSESE